MALILLIDDDAPTRQPLRRALELAGHAVIEAANGEEGLRLFQAKRPDAVVTDILMPEREGIETIMALRKATPPPAIVAISGGGRMGRIEVLDVARKFGADAALAKPVRPKELVNAVAQALAARPRGAAVE